MVKDNMMVMIQPKPAQFSEKENSYQVSKNGYISIDFTPLNEAKQIDPSQKRTIILTMKNVGDILDLDTRLPYDSAVDEEGAFVQYQQKENEPIKVLRMNKLPGKLYKFSYCEISEGQEVKNVLSLDLTYGEVRNIQTLIEYSVPLLLGWHCIYNPSVVTSK